MVGPVVQSTSRQSTRGTGELEKLDAICFEDPEACERLHKKNLQLRDQSWLIDDLQFTIENQRKKLGNYNKRLSDALKQRDELLEACKQYVEDFIAPNTEMLDIQPLKTVIQKIEKQTYDPEGKLND